MRTWGMPVGIAHYPLTDYIEEGLARLDRVLADYQDASAVPTLAYPPGLRAA